MLEQLNKAKQENKTHAARKLQYPPKLVNVCPENPKSDKEEVPSQTEDEGEDTKLEGDIGENLDENDDGNQTLMDTDSDLTLNQRVDQKCYKARSRTQTPLEEERRRALKVKRKGDVPK